ncbi:MAG: hypothetical protein U0232_20205 [Thermomicrobiales bacterium]
MGREIAATNESQSAASDDADGESARPRSAAPHYSSLATRHALALFLAFLGFYLLTLSGHFYAVDEETLYVQTAEHRGARDDRPAARGLGMVLSPQHRQQWPGLPRSSRPGNRSPPCRSTCSGGC